MAISKVVYKANAQDSGTTWVDMTADTATADKILTPYTAHIADGTQATGTATPGGGGGGGDWNDPIRFFDYDGTLVASYTSVPASLPAVPTHSKLTNGTWNYTLAQITTQFNAMGTCDVGANYDTVSGKTEIDVVFTDVSRLSPYLRFAVNGTVTVDWGDGTATSTVTGTSLTSRKNTNHTYALPGHYTITLEPSSGTTYSMYSNSESYPLLHKGGAYLTNIVYGSCVLAVRVGAGCTIGNYAFCNTYNIESISIPADATVAGSSFKQCQSLVHLSLPAEITSVESSSFYSCYSMRSISIPSGVTSIGSSAFRNCFSLSHISIPSGAASIGDSAFFSCFSLASASVPSGITSFGANTFNSCYSLMYVTSPSGLTSFGGSAFYNCYSLASIRIPSLVTTIDSQVFYSCQGLGSIHFYPLSPPTVSNSNTFTNIPTDCIIYVPTGTLSAYTTATNYPSSSTYTYVEE